MSYAHDKLHGDMFLLHGSPGTGKTVMAASFGKNYRAFDIERGGKYAYNKDQRVVCKNLNDFKSQLGRVAKQPAVDTLIVDTFGRLCLWIDRDICDSNGCQSLGAVPHGGGWGQYTNAVAKLLDELRQTGKTVVLICHTKIVDDKVKTVGMSATIGIYVMGEADHIGYCFKRPAKPDGMEYLVSFGGSDVVHAKSRFRILNSARTLQNNWAAIEDWINGYCADVDSAGKPFSEEFKQLLTWAARHFQCSADEMASYLDAINQKTETAMTEFIKKIGRSVTKGSGEVNVDEFKVKFDAWLKSV